MRNEVTSLREPELDPISHQIDKKFYWDLPPELRAEVLKIKQMQEQTKLLTWVFERVKGAFPAQS